MTDIRLSYSSLRSLVQCERQFTLRYKEGIVQDGPSTIQQALGSWYHAFAAVHNLKQGLKHESLIWVPSTLEIIDGLTVHVDVTESGNERMGVPGENAESGAYWLPLTPSGVLELCRAWWSQQPADWQARFEEKYKEPLPERVTDMWRRYRLRWKHLDNERIPLLVEYEWQRPITKAADAPLLNGRLDLMYLDTKRNLIVNSDLKTAASWPSDTERETAMWDSQLNMGLWGVKEYVKTAAPGHPLLKDRELNFAIEYDRGRTKKPSLPKLVNSRSKEGPAKVKSKAACDTDAWTYTQWLKSEEAQEFGVELDPEYLSELETDTDRWFRRGMIPENPHVIRIHLMAALSQSSRIDSLTLETALPIPSTMGCAGCTFREICSMTLMGVPLQDLRLSDFGLTVKGSEGVEKDLQEEGVDDGS